MDDSGEIVYWSMQPVNVDCDSGKHDTQFITRKYKTFDDFRSRNFYYENIKER